MTTGQKAASGPAFEALRRAVERKDAEKVEAGDGKVFPRANVEARDG